MINKGLLGVQLRAPIFNMVTLSRPPPTHSLSSRAREKHSGTRRMGFRYREGTLRILENPSEAGRALQQKGLKADRGGTFQVSWHS